MLRCARYGDNLNKVKSCANVFSRCAGYSTSSLQNILLNFAWSTSMSSGDGDRRIMAFFSGCKVFGHYHRCSCWHVCDFCYCSNRSRTFFIFYLVSSLFAWYWIWNHTNHTVCMISLCICQPRVPEGRSGLLDHPTLPFLVCPFLQNVACFLFIADAHLLTGCMALQTVRSVLIAVCKGQLAFRRCSPSIFKN